MRGSLKNALSAPQLYFFLMKIRPYIGRYFFIILCCIGFIWYTLFTRRVIKQIHTDSVTVTKTYAELIRTAIANRMSDAQTNVVFEEVIRKSNFPIVITDTMFVPMMWKNITVGPWFRREKITSDDTRQEARIQVEKCLGRFREIYEPKPIVLSETGEKIGYLFFGNSDIVQSLSWMPLLEIGLVLAIVILSYISFHNIRITERSNLWVALAKETAHQLGTPISSLMGWVEFMQTSSQGNEGAMSPDEFMTNVEKICGDMNNDLIRLRKITNRFSQIGSLPDLTPNDISVILEEAMQYFQRRLPLLGRRIEIRSGFSETPLVEVNRDLMEWVFENLLKNAINAIDAPIGLIEVRTEFVEVDHIVRVVHKDNGRGISWDEQKRIFAPGYTTKKRGWGIGLTLAKRIVEDYHRGRIYVAWSQKDKGTAFHIDLPVRKSAGKRRAGKGGTA